MPNQSNYLTPGRRVTLAWSLIAVALLCQLTRDLSIVNIFVILAAAAIHEILIPAPHRPWEKWLVRIMCWCLFGVFFVLALLHRLPPEGVIYGIVAAFILPFLVLAIMADIRFLRNQSKPE